MNRPTFSDDLLGNDSWTTRHLGDESEVRGTQPDGRPRLFDAADTADLDARGPKTAPVGEVTPTFCHRDVTGATPLGWSEHVFATSRPATPGRSFTREHVFVWLLPNRMVNGQAPSAWLMASEVEPPQREEDRQRREGRLTQPIAAVYAPDVLVAEPPSPRQQSKGFQGGLVCRAYGGSNQLAQVRLSDAQSYADALPL